MADSEIRVSIRGFSGDLKRALADARGDVRQFSRSVETENRRVERSNRDVNRSFVDVDGAVRGFNQSMLTMRNTVSLVKWPALIAGAGAAAQAVTALGAGVVGLTGALGPLSGALAAYPSLLGAAAQATATWRLAAGDLQEALGGNEEALKRLTPEARRFVRELKGMKPELDELRDAAGEHMFDGLTRGLERADDNLDVLKEGLHDTGAVMGRLAAQAGALVGSEGFGSRLQSVMGRNAITIGRLGRSGLQLGDALATVTAQAGPLVGWMSKLALEGSRWVNAQARIGAESGRMRAFFAETREVIEVLGPATRDFAVALANVAGAGSGLGRALLGDLREVAREFRQWTESAGGRADMAAYFERALPAIRETAGLVGDIGAAVLRLGAGEGFVELVRKVRSDVVPAMEQLVATTTEALGPELVDMAVSFAKTLAVLSGPTGGLGLLIRGLTAMSDALRAILEAPGLGTFAFNMITVAGAWKVLKFAGMVSAATKLAGLWRGIAASSAATAAATGAGAAAGAAGAAGAGAAAVPRMGPAMRLAGIGAAAFFANGLIEGLTRPDLAFTDRLGVVVSGGLFQPKTMTEKLQNALDQALRGGDIRFDGWDEFWGEIEEPLDEKGKAAIRKLREVREQAIAAFGPGVKLTPEVALRPERALRDLRLLRNEWGRMREGALTSVRDIRQTASDQLARVARTLGLRSKEGKDAVVFNFRTAAGAVRDAMSDGRGLTDRGGREIARLLRVHSREGRDALKGNMDRVIGILSETMRRGGRITDEGLALIRRAYEQELRLYGFTPRQAAREAMPGTRYEGGPEEGSRGPTRRRRGGTIPGVGSGDRVPVMAEPGEGFINRNAVAALGGPGVIDLINRAFPRFQGGGIVPVPGFPGESAASHVLDEIAWVARNFPGLVLTDAYGQGHKSPGHTVYGTAADFSGPDSQMDAAVRALVSKGYLVGYDGRFGSQDWPGHGPSTRTSNYHLHVEFGQRGGTITGGVASAVPKLGRVVVEGPESALRSVVQGGLDNVRGAAQKKLEDAAAAALAQPVAGGGGLLAGDGAVERVFASVAKRLSTSRVATLALGMAGYAESGMQDLPGGDASSQGALQLLASTAAGLGVSPHDEGSIASLFLLRGFYGRGGANQLAAQGLPAHLVAQNVQGSAFASGSNYLAQEGRARGWMGRYGLQRGGVVGRALEAAGRVAPFRPLRRPRAPSAFRGKGGPFPTGELQTYARDPLAQFGQLELRVEDLASLYSDELRAAELDEQLTPDELRNLLGRTFSIRNAVRRQIDLAGGILTGAQRRLPGVQAALDLAVPRARALKDRQRGIDRELEKLDRKSKPTKADRARKKELREERGKVRAALRDLVGDPDASVADARGRIGALRGERETLTDRVSTFADWLRPSRLPASLREWEFAESELKGRGAEAPEPAEAAGATAEVDDQVAGLLRELLEQSLKERALLAAQLEVFRGFAPYLGRFQHGGVAVRDGLAYVHQGERVVPDPAGPFATTTAAAAGGPQSVEVTLRLDDAGLLRIVDQRVDGRAARVVGTAQGRRAVRIARAPGR